MKKQIDVKNEKSICIAISLILLLSAGFFFTSHKINEIAQNDGLKILESSAKQLIVEIEDDTMANYEHLNTIARILSSYDDLTSQEANNIICAFSQQGLISTVGLLLPDDSMLLCDGRKQQTQQFRYEEEAKRVPYISDRVTFPTSGEMGLYQAVPVLRDGNTVGLLYGFVDLEEFSEKYSLVIFGQSAGYVIVDGATGDMIADTWHASLGNINDSEFSTRKTISENSFDDLKQDAKDGESGYVIFSSKSLSGGYMYAAYMPAGINNWHLMVSAPQEAVLATASQIKQVFYILGFTDIVVSLAGLIWILTNAKNRARKREWELRKTLYIVEVQKILMEAHTDAGILGEALKICADTMEAKRAFLLTIRENGTGGIYAWSKSKHVVQREFAAEQIQALMTAFGTELKKKESVLVSDEQKDKLTKEEQDILEKWNIVNLMMVPVMNSQGRLNAVLGVTDCRQERDSIELLKCVTPYFYMSILNYESYRKIKEMGVVDMLTGLQNRNCYQQDVLRLSRQDPHSLCCIYMDANGLHELNNKYGHAAGDRMLCAIGKELQSRFGRENAYRIGGDEFVVFCKDMSQQVVDEKIEQFRNEMDRQNIAISIGSVWKDTSLQIDAMVTSAEKEMYEDKRRYYEKKGNVENVGTRLRLQVHS